MKREGGVTFFGDIFVYSTKNLLRLARPDADRRTVRTREGIFKGGSLKRFKKVGARILISKTRKKDQNGVDCEDFGRSALQ